MWPTDSDRELACTVASARIRRIWKLNAVKITAHNPIRGWTNSAATVMAAAPIRNAKYVIDRLVRRSVNHSDATEPQNEPIAAAPSTAT